MPKVSILVPIFGVEKYIERSAISLFEQTYENIEYIFVNDFTKDNSIGILKDVIERYPHRKTYVRIIEHEHNKGLGAARNTAVAAATGEFLIHVDSDDYVDLSYVEKMIRFQERDDYDIITCDHVCVGEKFSQYIRSLETNDSISFAEKTIKHEVRNSVWGRLIRRSLYTDNKISVKEGINMSEDLQVTPKLFFYANKIGFLHECLVYYNCTNINSYTYNFSEPKEMQIFETLDMLEAFFAPRDAKLCEAVLCRKYANYTSAIIKAVQSNDGEQFYRVARKKLDNIDKKYSITTSFVKRTVVRIRNFYVLRKVVEVLSFLNKYLKYYSKTV